MAAKTRRVWAVPGRERDLVVQSLKAAAAAVLAWVIAARWLGAPMPYIAPWVAVLLVRATVHQSLTHSFQQLCAVALGAVLATLSAMVLTDPAVSMAVVLPVIMLVGQWRGFGSEGVNGVTAALFTLILGEASLGTAVSRILEVLLGAAVALAVNVAVRPPVHLRSASHAVDQIRTEATDILRAVAEGLTDSWTSQEAHDWHSRARRLPLLVDHARSAITHGWESTRLNPRPRARNEARRRHAPHQQVASVVDRLAEYLTDLTRTLMEAADESHVRPLPQAEVTDAYARFVHQVADAVDAYGRIVLDEDATGAARDLQRAVGEGRQALDRLHHLVAVAVAEQPGWIALYGTLMSDADRLVEDLSPDQRLADVDGLI